MNRNILLITFITFLSLGAHAQTIFSDKNAQKRDVKPFSAIHVKGAITVYLSQGSEEALAVSARETGYRENIVTEVRNGVLHISFDQSGPARNPQLKAYVSYKNLSSLQVSGASDIYFQDIFKGDAFKVSLTGASNLKGPVELKNLEVILSGASDVQISGQAANLKLSSSGASDFKSPRFTAGNAIVDLSGASDANLKVRLSLDAKASGASTLHYSGSPQTVKQNVSGAASLKRVDR